MSVIWAPVVMAIAGHNMNGMTIPLEEMVPEDWLGKPVTIGHPAVKGEFIAARSSDAVGSIAHAWVEGSKLRATLKLDAALLPADVLKLIEREKPLDVSTGFFSEDDGNTSRNILPDHLALLPREEGACSWADGCGLRAQSKSGLRVNCVCHCGECAGEDAGLEEDDMSDYRRMLAARIDGVLHTRERGSDDDRRQIIADLISDDRSPFTPEDEQSLRMMSDNTLAAQAERYLGGKRRVRARVMTADPEIRAMSAHKSDVQLGNDIRCAERALFVPRNQGIRVNADDPELRAMTAGDTLLHANRDALRRSRNEGEPETA